MADRIQATPRSPILGLFSDIVNLPLQYMSSPERTQQLQGAAQFFYGTGVPQTLERLSYGEPLTTGSGGLGGTTRLRPETADAVLNVAPFAPVAGRVATRAVRATEGLPVGMSIKDVSPKIGINVNQGGNEFADKIISGVKKYETRESDSLRPYVGKRVGIIRTGEGKAKAIGDVTIGEPIVVSSAEEFAKLRDLHLVPEGSKFDIKEGGVKYLYPIENPVAYDVEKDVAKYGIVSRKILGEPDTLEKAIYPQQAALDLAQQRAALPVEQGGLGLPANNTAADRANHPLMQFINERYHETEAKNIPTIANYDVRRPVAGASDEQTPYGMFVKPSGARIGVAKEGETQMPLLVKSNLTDQNVMRSFMDREDLQYYLNQFPDLKKATSDVRSLDNQMADYMEKETNKAFALQDQGKTAEADKIFAMFNSDSNVMQEFNKQMAEKTAIAKDLITKHFQDQKFGSVGLVNDQGAFGKQAITEIILNPENVRSRFAAFDPFRKDVATATAMGVALPDLLAQPTTQYRPTYEPLPLYTDPFGNTIDSSIR